MRQMTRGGSARSRRSGRDPAPTRLRYRLQRWMLTPYFRLFLRKGLPVLAVAAAAGLWASDPGNRQWVRDTATDLRVQFQSRPEFLVRLMAIDGVEGELASEVRAALPVEFPASSFELDLEAMRQAVEALGPVRTASLYVRQGGVLQVDVTPRLPVAVWRTREGLRLIDASGVFVATVDRRADHPDLPLIAGEGARDELDEALAIFEAAAPLMPRVRGLVRMGERRWDLVLDRNQRILLPAARPVIALDRVVALGEAQELLDRDVAGIDFRNTKRPTIRLTPASVEILRAARSQSREGDKSQ